MQLEIKRMVMHELFLSHLHNWLQIKALRIVIIVNQTFHLDGGKMY
jgi:hypothetical protein